MNGIDIESIIIDDIDQQMAQRIRESIDNSLLVDLLISTGWTRVDTEITIYDPDAAAELQRWLSTHTVGRYRACDDRIAFELGQDATLFRLRWA